eukprot:2250533-Amphidinium_carterae.2
MDIIRSSAAIVMLLHLLKPLFNMLEGRSVSSVVNKDETVRVPVIIASSEATADYAHAEKVSSAVSLSPQKSVLGRRCPRAEASPIDPSP